MRLGTPGVYGPTASPPPVLGRDDIRCDSRPLPEPDTLVPAMMREVKAIPPAPRRVGWGQVLWSRWPIALLGFLLAVYGGAFTLMLFFAVGGKARDDSLLDEGAVALATGTVTAVRADSGTIDGGPAELYEYVFRFDSRDAEGKSLGAAGLYRVGDRVEVEHSPDRDHPNRIRGTRLNLLPAWIHPGLWLGLLVFPGILALMLWVQGVCDLRRMLSHGDVGVAEVLEIRRVRVVVPGMLSVTFRFRDHRARQRIGRHWVRTRSPLGSRLLAQMASGRHERMPVLHHRRWPQFSRLCVPDDFVQAGSQASAEETIPL